MKIQNVSDHVLDLANGAIGPAEVGETDKREGDAFILAGLGVEVEPEDKKVQK